jgi:hypothetical protein
MKGPYFDEYNLVVNTPYAKLRENSLLWTAQYFFLTRDADVFLALDNAIERCRVSRGLYKQHPGGLFGEDRYMSHDQLTAIMSFSYDQHLYFHKEIWNEIETQGYLYNNLKDGKIRLLHLRDLCFYGYLCGSWRWKLLIPLLIFFVFFSWKSYKIIDVVKVPKTDDELLNFVRFSTLRKNSKLWELLWKLYYKKVCKEHGSYNAVFRIYFPAENHPNVVASENF